MRILLGKEQFKTIEEMREIEREEKRKEFWNETIQMLGIGLGGGTVGAFALLGLCTYLGVA